MSLGTSAIKGWWGCAKIPGWTGRFHGNPVSWNQPCKHRPTSTVSPKELQWRNLPDPVPTMKHISLRPLEALVGD